ncbi:hypothetical protein [Flavobacterium album]|nr:hypothetical protein [Flavobacterium album]
MLIWNLDNDSIEPGQWIDKKIQVRRCDISPTGTYLIYLIDHEEYQPSRIITRTVISRPPYWMDLAAWEHENTLFGTGGGLFDDENTIVLNVNNPVEPLSGLPIPASVKIATVKTGNDYNVWKGQINTLLDHRLQREGWAEISDDKFVAAETSGITHRNPNPIWAELQHASLELIVPKLWKKAITNSTSLLRISFYHSEHRKNFDFFYIAKKDKKTKLKGIKWADTDNNNRIIATKEGRLYASKVLGDGSVDYANLELILDLNPQQPKRILTPESMKQWV